MRFKPLSFLTLPPILILLAANFIFGIFLIKWFWGWTIPALFPLAIKTDINLIAAEISWGTAFKLSIFFSLLIALHHLTQALNLKKLLFFCIGIILVKLFWAWTVPALSPAGVAENLIAKSISWWSAVKFSILFTLLSTVSTFKQAPDAKLKQ